MTEAPSIPDDARPDDVARLVSLTPRRVRQICVEHNIASGKRGLVPVAPVIRAVIEAAKLAHDGDALSAAKARREAARARVFELQALEAEGKVIDIDEHIAVVDEICGIIVAGLTALPARAARNDPRARRKIEDVCDAIRTELAGAAAKRAAELRGTGYHGEKK